MTWHVQFRRDGADHIDRRPTPEAAIEHACELMDQGVHVHGIGTGPLTDSIGHDEIAKIYELWLKARPYRTARAQAEHRPHSGGR